MTNKADQITKFLAVFLLASVALVMLPACSSTDESTSDAPTEDSMGGGNCEDCGIWTNDIDIKECEVRNSMRSGC
jgi:hypothetical protein